MEEMLSEHRGRGSKARLTDEEALERWADAVEAGLEVEMCALCKGSAGVADLDISHALGNPKPSVHAEKWIIPRWKVTAMGCWRRPGSGAMYSICSWQEHPPGLKRQRRRMD